MGSPIPVLDEIETHAECDGAQTVEQGVEPRQKDPLARQGWRRVVNIEQPQQKGDRNSARFENSP
jgi:hypothetical protein